MKHEDNEYEKLCTEIWYHNKKYYVDHDPEISDHNFDAILHRLEDMEREHPEWITPASPTQRVGEMTTEGFEVVKHDVPMMSLANTYSKEELQDFVKRVEKQLGRGANTLSAELKMDAIAISIRYENGILVRGLTRGDGKQGDEITANVRTIASLPLCLHGGGIPEILELPGDVFMPLQTFGRLNAHR